jgi:hypothetical protein
MPATDSLYSEVKPDISALATPLFDFSELCLKKRGNFLPHGAVLTEGGEVKLVGAAPNADGGSTTSAEVLPILHQGLRMQAKQFPLNAVAVAENVTVTLEGRQPTKAIKALFEHRRGLTVALYLPFEKRFLRGYVFGNTFSVTAASEVNAWAAVA